MAWDKTCTGCRRGYSDEFFGGNYCPECYRLLFALERVNASVCDDPGDPAECIAAWDRIERIVRERRAIAQRGVVAS